MRITDDVIRDLYPLYAAGEASPDTRALVDTWFSAYPALAAELKRADAYVLPGRAPAPAGPAPPGLVGRPVDAMADSERAALRRVKSLLRRRGWAMAVGIFFGALPFSCEFSDSGFRFILWSQGNAPFLALSLLIGVAGWIEWFRLGRKLRPVGF